MEAHIKIAPRHYERLRSQIPNDSPAYQAIDKATRIDHSIGGVLFEGYDIPCNEEQARSILETARVCCPEIISDIEEAIKLAQPR